MESCLTGIEIQFCKTSSGDRAYNTVNVFTTTKLYTWLRYFFVMCILPN